MIVPSDRLLHTAGAVLVPAAVVAAFAPEMSAAIVGVVSVFVLVAVGDALLGRTQLSGLSAALPPIVRLTKDRAGTLEVRLTNESRGQRPVRVALALPKELACESPDLLAHLPEGELASRISFTVTPSERGRYALERVHMEVPSPLGLFLHRGWVLAPSEVRVYPNLLAERRSVASLFLNRGAFGVHARRQVGRGREFEKLRDYVPGDDTSEIHWKATARRARPVTKIFRRERTQEVYVVLDASRLSGRRLTRRDASEARETRETREAPTALERFVTAALILGVAAQRQGDLFGLVAFSERVTTFVPARGGKAHFRTCRDALYQLNTQPVTPDFEELFTFLRGRLRRRALLVFLTELDDPMLAESFASGVHIVSRQHLVLVNAFQPPAARPLFSDVTVSSVDDVYERLAGHFHWQALRQLGTTLKRRGVTLSLLPHESAAAELVSEYMVVKSRQAL